MNFAKQILKTKILVDYLIDSFSNSYKVLFLVDELGVSSPRELCKILKMAKSNLAVLAGKLRLLKYLEQTKQKDNHKEITYRVTPLGKEKLNAKLNSIKIKQEEKDHAIKTLREILNGLDN